MLQTSWKTFDGVTGSRLTSATIAVDESSVDLCCGELIRSQCVCVCRSNTISYCEPGMYILSFLSPSGFPRAYVCATPDQVFDRIADFVLDLD